MNRTLLLSLLFIGAGIFNGYNQCIPDQKFAAAINAHCPGCIDNYDCLTPAAQSLLELEANNLNITDITGVEGFTSLQQFYCSDNQLTFIPPLPASLKVFYCNDNQIISLPSSLPPSLEEFKCENNLITSLPPLPDQLELLFCSENNITALPALPVSLDNLTCNDNALSFLPPLPDNLTSLHCNVNSLTKLPELPSNLEKLYCSKNELTALPDLPATLNILDMSYNYISCVPTLPYDLQFFDYSSTEIHCLPNVPAIFESNPPFELCADSCAIHPVVTGSVFVDYNGNNIKDGGDIAFPGLNVITDAGNWIGYTDATGNYKMNAGLDGTYSISVIPPPGMYTTFPLAYTLSFDDTTGQTVGNMNFAVEPDANNYDLEVDLTPGEAVSGEMTNYYLTYTNKGPFTINGSAELLYDVNMNYLSADVAPSSQSGNLLKWNFNALLPFASKTISITFDVPTSVLAGTKLLVSTSCTLSTYTDIFPDNNSQVDSTIVLPIAGSNHKAVSQTKLTPQEVSGNKMLEYIIYFQNTGVGTAQNIEIYDSLSTNLAASGFELISGSHHPSFELGNDVQNAEHPLILHWSFSNVNLPSYLVSDLDSRGFVKFRVRPLSTLVVGDMIENIATIEFNNLDASLSTNSTITHVAYPVSANAPLTEIVDLQVYPNPFEGSFTLDCRLAREEAAEIKIYNAIGEVIWQKSFDSGVQLQHYPIDTRELPAGPYLLLINSKTLSGSAKIWKQ